MCIRDSLWPVMIEVLELADGRFGSTRLLEQDRFLIEQVRVTRAARQRIVDARQGLIVLPTIGQQLRLRDLGAHPRRRAGAVGGLKQLQCLIALTLLVEQRGSAIARRTFERGAAEQLIAAQRRSNIVAPISEMCIRDRL